MWTVMRVVCLASLLAGVAACLSSCSPKLKATITSISDIGLTPIDPARFSSDACGLFGDAASAACRASTADATVKNQELVEWIRIREQPLSASIPRAAGARPPVCLALSGGGVRAAAFSLGVLRGLAEQRPASLDQFAVISGVSGSTYTMGWLYRQLVRETGKAPSDVVLDDSRLDSLEKKVASTWGTGPVYAGIVAGVFIGRPTEGFVRFADRQADPRQPYAPEQSFARDGYARSIAQVFLNGDESIGMRELSGALLARESLVTPTPIPIFGATVGRGALRCNDDRPLDVVSFEMGPSRFGSEGEGYTYAQVMKRSDLATLIAISASAPDNPCSVALGAVTTITGRFGAKIDLFPGGKRLFFAGAPAGNLQQPMILGDGGFSENLAILPLVRRMCQTILVVDGEEDPHLDFTGLTKVANNLERSYGFRLSIDSTGAIPRSSGPLCASQQEAANCYRSSKTSPLGFSARVSSIPWTSRLPNELEGEIRVSYLKLSVDRENPQLYSDQLNRYVDQLKKDCGRRHDSDCAFPHDPTTNQQFSVDKWRAYVNLGRHAVKTCITSDLSVRGDCDLAARGWLTHLR